MDDKYWFSFKQFQRGWGGGSGYVCTLGFHTDGRVSVCVCVLVGFKMEFGRHDNEIHSHLLEVLTLINGFMMVCPDSTPDIIHNQTARAVQRLCTLLSLSLHVNTNVAVWHL